MCFSLPFHLAESIGPLQYVHVNWKFLALLSPALMGEFFLHPLSFFVPCNSVNDYIIHVHVAYGDVYHMGE